MQNIHPVKSETMQNHISQQQKKGHFAQANSVSVNGGDLMTAASAFSAASFLPPIQAQSPHMSKNPTGVHFDEDSQEDNFVF